MFRRRGGFLLREWWEYDPSPEHRSLVLTLYRNILKELINFKSIRRKSITMHTRLTFRRRAQATEKLLIDEAIEEARRAVYVLKKHTTFQKTGEYQYDDMFLPKDTGQDVAAYMEEVYDPAVSKQQYANVADVVPGREDLHQAAQMERAKHNKGRFESTIKEEDHVFRPPPPPTG